MAIFGGLRCRSWRRRCSSSPGPRPRGRRVQVWDRGVRPRSELPHGRRPRLLDGQDQRPLRRAGRGAVGGQPGHAQHQRAPGRRPAAGGGFMSPFAFISAVRDLLDGIVTIGGGITDGAGVRRRGRGGRRGPRLHGHPLPRHRGEHGAARVQADGDHHRAGQPGHHRRDHRDPRVLAAADLVANGLDPDHLVRPAGRVYDSTTDVAARCKDLSSSRPRLGDRPAGSASRSRPSSPSSRRSTRPRQERLSRQVQRVAKL